MTTLARTAPKISRASSRPLMTRTLMPVSASMRSTTAAESRASRRAAVPQATISSASQRFGQRPEAPDHVHRGAQPAAADLPGGGYHAAQPEHLLVADQRLEGAVGVGVGDQEVEGVAPQVEGRDPHRPPTVHGRRPRAGELLASTRPAASCG